jgi:hypothetical protein
VDGRKRHLATLKPWQPGNTAPRRSNDVDRALRYARKMAPEALILCAKVLQDASIEERVRLKAAEIILLHGMPKDASRRDLTGERVTGITIVIERGETHAEPLAAAPQLERPTITINSVAEGSGDD